MSDRVAIKLDEFADGEDVADSWRLVFRYFQSGSDPGFKGASFTVHEPYLFSEASWRHLADGGDTCFNCYCGNGEGSIKCKDGVVKFVGAPSGAGGDVDCVWSADASYFGPELHAALDDAVAKGLTFDTPKDEWAAAAEAAEAVIAGIEFGTLVDEVVAQTKEYLAAPE